MSPEPFECHQGGTPLSENHCDARPGRNLALDNARTVGCFLIVVFHVCMADWFALDPTTALWRLDLAGISASYAAVPLFFMISGALFLDPRRQVTVRSIWTHTLPHLAVIYFVWSGWFAWSSSGLNAGVSPATLAAFAKDCLYGSAHQWFLWPLAGFYIVTPLLRRITEDKRLLEYFLAVCFFLAVLPVSSHFTVHFALYETLTGLLQLNMASGYMFYFLAGYYLTAYPLRGKRRALLYLAGAAGLLATGLGATYLRFFNDGQLVMWLDPSRAHSGLYALALFAAIQQLTPHLPAVVQRVSEEIARCSFGIYMIHITMMVQGMVRLNYLPLVEPTLWKVPVLICFAFVTSLGVSMILRRIPFLKRILF